MAIETGTGTLLNEHRAQLAQELSASALALNRAAVTAERLSRILNEVDFENQSASEQQSAFLSVLSATRDLHSTFSLHSSHDGEGAASKKRARKEKDPDAPKKPITSYMMFQEEKRKEMVNANPEIPYKEVLAMIGQQWKAMTDEQKAPYVAAQHAAQAKHTVELAAYEKGKGVSPVSEKPKKEKEKTKEKEKDKPKEKESKSKAKDDKSTSKSRISELAKPAAAVLAATSKPSSKSVSKPAPAAAIESSSEESEEGSESSENSSSGEESSSEAEEPEPQPAKKKAKVETKPPPKKTTSVKKK